MKKKKQRVKLEKPKDWYAKDESGWAFVRDNQIAFSSPGLSLSNIDSFRDWLDQAYAYCFFMRGK